MRGPPSKYLIHWIDVLALTLTVGCNDTIPPEPPPLTEWKVFTSGNSPLLNNRIHFLLQATDATMWIATDSGACSYRRGSWAYLTDSLIYRQFGALKDTRRISSIVEAKDKSLWFCLPGGGVTRYNPFSNTLALRRYREPDLSSNVVASGASETSARTQFGELLFATPHGICRYIQTTETEGAWLWYSRSDSGEHISAIPANNILIAARQPDEPVIWFGSESGAVSAGWEASGIVWTGYELPAAGVSVRTVAFDLYNQVWLGRAVGGAYILNQTSGSWASLPNHAVGGKLPDGPVNIIATDLLRKRWFGGEGGLVELNDTSWSFFTTANSPLPSDTITALAYDSRGNLWIGTERGLAVYNSGGVTL